jgi:hypothetical protein
MTVGQNQESPHLLDTRHDARLAPLGFAGYGDGFFGGDFIGVPQGKEISTGVLSKVPAVTTRSKAK